MYYHRTYVEKSDYFEQMCSLISYLNSYHLCDWSFGRLMGWKYGRWSKEHQIDSIFEKQAELFFNDSDELCGIVITENFGESYYILSKKNEELIQIMTDFLLQGGNFNKPYIITVCENDSFQKDILERNGFAYFCDEDVTYTYYFDDINLQNVTIPNKFTLASQKEYLDKDKVEMLRFLSFNPNGVYDEILDYAYKYSRNNPILIPELAILLLNEDGEPISGCIGYLDKKNGFMEVEVVVTKKEYENRGFAKIVISECIRKGIAMGVKEISISAWEEKTRKIYSSFGKPQVLQKINYKKSAS